MHSSTFSTLTLSHPDGPTQEAGHSPGPLWAVVWYEGLEPRNGRYAAGVTSSRLSPC
jgi:hypothetical protein